MNREREFAESLRGILGERLRLHSPAGALETQAQGKTLVGVAELAEEASHFVGAPTGVTNDAKRRGNLRRARLRGLEQRAIELAATRGSIIVNAAPAIGAKGRARLPEADLPAHGFQRNTQRSEPGRIIVRLQLDVAEQHTAAAQPAGEAKLIRLERAGAHRHAGRYSPRR